MSPSRRAARSGRCRRLVAVLAALTSLLATTLAAAAGASADTGVDVSRWQHPNGGSLNWYVVKADGISFAFIKATEGGSYTNPYFADDWAATAAFGIYHGAYHFARPSRGTAAAQARYFVATAGVADQPGDLPPVLDLEDSGGLPVAALTTWVTTWLSTVQELTGRVPVIYVSPNFWTERMGDSTAFSGYPLWIANYHVSEPRVPGGWSTWTFWQTTSTGRVTGISGDVDMNTFNGTSDQLAALAQVEPVDPGTDPGTPTPPPPTEPAPVDAATTTTLTVDRTTVWPDTTVALSGQVLDAATGAPVPDHLVTISRKVDGALRWRRVATVSTDAAGGFALPFVIDRTAAFRAVATRDGGYLRSVSAPASVALREKLLAAVELAADRSRVRAGRAVELYGHVRSTAGQPLPRRSVTVLARRDGTRRWTEVATARSVAPTGWYQALVRPREDTVYKAVFRGAAHVARAVSAPVAVDVR